jgi:hypothetical protein
MVIDGFERPCGRVGFMQLLVVLVFHDNVAELVAGNDLVKFPPLTSQPEI